MPDQPPARTTAADALRVLREALGDAAEFRDGQLESIQRLVDDRARLLVVQRTGWGKSSVYFVTTRLLREQGSGPTVLISPLLALMRDQIRAAERFGLVAATINSTNTDEWDEITERVAAGEVDLLLVSPERLASAVFRDRVLAPLMGSVGLFVVDEAHCISDWGHDFRPDYRRIRALIPELPDSAAVLATTATASNVVVADVVEQLGGSVQTLRGPLSRSSLSLQAIGPMSEAERMAWLAQHLPDVDGSGIIYVLTKAHAHRLAGFLRARGIDAEAYTGGGKAGGVDEQTKLELERRLLANEITAIVATPALGMGFDKPDLAFVIHFQMPQSLIHYYQQVGRAGRAVDDALGVLLHGPGDKRITDYFIAQAFPPAAVFDVVVRTLQAAPNGLSTTELAKRSRVARALTDKVLGQLAVEVDSPVRRRGATWQATGVSYAVDEGRIQDLTRRRRDEQDRIAEYARGGMCHMAFIAAELDDPTAGSCGRCAVCLGYSVVDTSVDVDLVVQASEYSDSAAATGRKRRTRRPRKPPSTTARTKRRRKRPK